MSGCFDFFSLLLPCSHQSPIDAVVSYPSISYPWPLCTSDIDLSLYSPLSVTCHTVPKGVQCVTKDGFHHQSLTFAVSPFPHTLASHLRGYRCGPPVTTVSRLGPREEFWRSHSRVTDLFFCNGGITWDQYWTCSIGSCHGGFVWARCNPAAKQSVIMLERLWQEIDHLMPFRNENSQHIVCFVP